MHAVRPGQHGEIGSVVREQRHTLRATQRHEGAQQREGLARSGLFGAQLQRRRARAQHGFGERDQLGPERVLIHDGIQAAHRPGDYGGGGRVSAGPGMW